MTSPADLAGTWTIDPAHTQIGFVARHAMVTKVRGTFDTFSGSLTIDPANPADSKVSFTADLASVNTGVADRDGHLRGSDFFDVENHKEMVFESTEVTVAGETGTLKGNLTIKGITQPVSIDVEIGGVTKDPFGNTRAGFEGTATISRKDFGLTWNAPLEVGGWLVSDEIKVVLDIAAIKQ
ncbi:MAG: YceI family protein [Actinomycetales bacterium]|nr:YceI family protein [Actinomycetales bacterium]